MHGTAKNVFHRATASRVKFPIPTEYVMSRLPKFIFADATIPTTGTKIQESALTCATTIHAAKTNIPPANVIQNTVPITYVSALGTIHGEHQVKNVFPINKKAINKNIFPN